MTTNGKVKVSISFTTDNMTDFEIHSFSICFHVISIIQCKVGKLLASLGVLVKQRSQERRGNKVKVVLLKKEI